MAPATTQPSAVWQETVRPSVTQLKTIKAREYNLSASSLKGLQTELKCILSPDQIVTDPEECFNCSTTDSAPAKPHQKPDIVVLPHCTEDVSKILDICCRLRIPVTSCSGRTSITGATISTRGGLCVDFQRMNKVLAVHKRDFDAVVQPGVDWMDLNEQLSGEGLFFPPDPGPHACIGGMVSTSCGGTNAYRFGTMKEWVIALTVVLADGTIVQTKRRPHKAANGYDLTHLMIGAEGTLGLVTEAVIKLTHLPENQHVAVVTFGTLKEATHAGLNLIESGLVCDAIELLDQSSIRCVNKAKLSERTWDEKPTLLLKLSGASNWVQHLVRSTKELFATAGSIDFECTQDPHERDMFWTARKFSARAFRDSKEDPSALYLCTDCAVPISRAAELMDEASQMAEELGMPSSFLAHLGNGNIHCQVLAPASDLETGQDLIRRIHYRAVDMDGTVSGEHGIGNKRRGELVYELGENAIDMMRSIKLALDPHCILNPDKILDLASPNQAH